MLAWTATGAVLANTAVVRYIPGTMTSSKDIRESFLSYFGERQHEVVPASSLVPQNDPTLMFVNAGMVPFKDVFTGQDKRAYTRATSSQKCIRISGKHNDLENVGPSARHHTFFEMLGNFSFGDYFKEEAIVYGWEYLTKVIGIDTSKLIVTVFGGEKDLPADTEAEDLWRKVSGLPGERLIRCGADENFWSMGDTGPCGPCSEIHYYFGEGEPDIKTFGQEPTEDGTGWVELWNLVFMQFNRDKQGALDPLPAPSIDTGMGLERIACVTQGALSNYDTDLLSPIVERMSEISGKKYGRSLAQDDVSMRVIADHARTAAFLIAEGIFPDRDAREYVLRRVMRRAIRHGHRLGIDKLFFGEAALLVTDIMGAHYPELTERRALIDEICQQEETRFRDTLKRGLDRLSSYKSSGSGTSQLPGKTAFELYDTYGFPLDLQEVIGREQGFDIDHAGFEAELERARERSRGSRMPEQAVEDVYRKLAATVDGGTVEFVGYDTQSASSDVLGVAGPAGVCDNLAAGQPGMLVTASTPFYGESGGQLGDSGVIRTDSGVFEVSDTQKPLDGLFVHLGKVTEGSVAPGQGAELTVDDDGRTATRRNHSATHLLHLALREVVGPHAMQKGSLVGADRLRFDYSAAKPLTTEQLARIEDLVNERVLRNEEVTTEVLSMDAAKERGAIGIFEEKYGDVVRMVRIADSLELCGGTHARRTGDIGAFKVLSDAGIAAGVRRIEAATGMNALAHTRRLETELTEAAALVKGAPLQAVEKVSRLLEQRKELQREIDGLKRKLLSGGAGDLTQNARTVGDITVLGAVVDIDDPKTLREMADKLRDQMSPAVVALGAATQDGKVVLVCTVSKDATDRYKAGKLIKDLAGVVGGGGGGRPDFAQAGGSDPSKLDAAMERLYELVS